MCTAVEALRRQRYTGAQIAAEIGISAATVSRILKRLGLNRLSALEPAEPVRRRYEREHQGQILHIKKLGKFNRIGHRITGDRTGQSNTRGVGWEYVHLAIDDHSRLACSEILLERRLVAPQGKRKLEQFLAVVMDERAGAGSTPRMIADARAQWAELDRRIAAFDAEFVRSPKENEDARRLTTISGCGAIVASALVASVGRAESFDRGVIFQHGLALCLSLKARSRTRWVRCISFYLT